ncbi:MAG: hypothetical protein ACRCXC_00020 [Legionella sp.]
MAENYKTKYEHFTVARQFRAAIIEFVDSLSAVFSFAPLPDNFFAKTWEDAVNKILDADERAANELLQASAVTARPTE